MAEQQDMSVPLSELEELISAIKTNLARVINHPSMQSATTRRRARN
jgi:hypothetical protein